MLLPDLQICEVAVPLELELGEGEEGDVLEIKNLFPALLWRDRAVKVSWGSV